MFVIVAVALVEMLMKKYAGRENTLFRELRKRYIDHQHTSSDDEVTQAVMNEVAKVYTKSVLPLEKM